MGFARYGQAGVEKSDHYVKKKHMRKRITSLFLVLAFCLTLLPTSALAEEPDTLDGERIETSIGNDTEGDGDIDNNVEE